MPPSVPRLVIVAETYRFRDDPPPWPWPDAELGTFTHILLSDTTTPEQIGAIVATEVYRLQTELGPTAAEWLDALLASGPFWVKGGVVASDGEQVIEPGCCCAVYNWREWQQFVADGQTPWMGHDPTGWAEWVGDVVRVWPGGGYTKTREGDPINFPREQFLSELASAERKLLAFLDRMEEWAKSLGYGHPTAVRQAFATSLLDEPKE